MFDDLDDEFDEFGNPVSRQADLDQDVSTADPSRTAYVESDSEDGDDDNNNDRVEEQRQVVSFQERQLYPSANAVYGDDVEVLVEEMDAQSLAEPLVAPSGTRQYRETHQQHQKQQPTSKVSSTASLPETTYSNDYLIDLLGIPERCRNVAVVGALHHGKTSLIDMLVAETHPDFSKQRADRFGPDGHRHVSRSARGVYDDKGASSLLARWTDTHLIERERGVSVHIAPVSLVLQSSTGSSYAMTLVDVPGHLDFAGEVSAALGLVDGVVLVVDAVEGVLTGTKRVIREVIRLGLSITLVVNKIDRLILELRLPPTDAYHKLRLIINDVNVAIAMSCSSTDFDKYRVTPSRGNVCFASAQDGWCISTPTLASIYINRWRSSCLFSADELSRYMWGDVAYNQTTRTFSKLTNSITQKRSFVHFFLEPLYKAYAQAIGEKPETLSATLNTAGVKVKPSQLRLNFRQLTQAVTQEVFGAYMSLSAALVDMCVHHVLSPDEHAKNGKLIERLYTGPRFDDTSNEYLDGMKLCKPDGPLVVYVTKMLVSVDGSQLHALGRILSGTLTSGSQVIVLSEDFTRSAAGEDGHDNDEEEEDTSDIMSQDGVQSEKVSGLWICQTRYNVPVSSLPAGSLCLIAGIDQSITGAGATVISHPHQPSHWRHVYPLSLPRPLSLAVLKIGVEPFKPAELPRLITGLRLLKKTYPLCQVIVEDTGEHVLAGTGELQLDCMMHDLRMIYAEIDIRVSNPAVSFRETVTMNSAVQCTATTLNSRNRFGMTCSVLERGLAEDIERGIAVDPYSQQTNSHTAVNFDGKKYGWNEETSRALWAFGPDSAIGGGNILVDDTESSDSPVDKKLLSSVKDSVVAGFRWAAVEGPLCGEPLRDIKFRVMDAVLSRSSAQRGNAQVIPAIRRVCHASMLVAQLTLLEPLLFAEILTPPSVAPTIYSILNKRRGHTISESPLPGTAYNRIEATIPAMDAFGFETDVRARSMGKAFVQQMFDGHNWAQVPGDPLDTSIMLTPLEPVKSLGHLARDYMIKTRRRRGLGDDISIEKYLDDLDQS